MAPYRPVYPPLLDEKKTDDCLIRIEEEEEVTEEVEFYAYERPPPAHSSQSFSHVLIFALSCSNILTLALAFFLYSGAYCPVVTLRDPFSLVPVSSASSASSSLRDSGALSSIRFEQRTFTSPPVNSSSSASSSARKPSTNPSYFGNPRDVAGIDRAWKDLLHGQFFALADDESAPLLHSGLATQPRTQKDPVYAELDVYHSLSCLNSVRMHLDRDYYADHGAQDGIGWRKWEGRGHVGEYSVLHLCTLDCVRIRDLSSASFSLPPIPPHQKFH